MEEEDAAAAALFQTEQKRKEIHLRIQIEKREVTNSGTLFFFFTFSSGCFSERHARSRLRL